MFLMVHHLHTCSDFARLKKNPSQNRRVPTLVTEFTWGKFSHQIKPKTKKKEFTFIQIFNHSFCFMPKVKKTTTKFSNQNCQKETTNPNSPSQILRSHKKRPFLTCIFYLSPGTSISFCYRIYTEILQIPIQCQIKNRKIHVRFVAIAQSRNNESKYRQ